MRPPNLTLHPPNLVMINLPSTLKAIPKLVSRALQVQTVCELRNYNILVSKPTHPLATRNKKGDREHQAQVWVTLCSTWAPRPGSARERFIYAKIHETRNKQGYLGVGTNTPCLTSASTCCWVRLWFSLYWLALRTCCSMPSRTASQPSHLHRREPALSCREAWEPTSLPNLPPQLRRHLLEHSVCRGSCPFTPAKGQVVTKYVRQGIWKQTQRTWSKVS